MSFFLFSSLYFILPLMCITSHPVVLALLLLWFCGILVFIMCECGVFHMWSYALLLAWSSGVIVMLLFVLSFLPSSSIKALLSRVWLWVFVVLCVMSSVVYLMWSGCMFDLGCLNWMNWSQIICGSISLLVLCVIMLIIVLLLTGLLGSIVVGSLRVL